VLSLVHRQLPASLNFTRPHPAIPLDDLGLRVRQELGPWPDDRRRLVAGVSSFGIGGTNCHLVLAEPPAPAPLPEGPRPPAGTWVLSARTAEALAGQAARLAEVAPALDPGDVGWSLASTRSVFEHRAVLTAPDRAGLHAGLTALAAGRPATGVLRGVA